MPFLEETADLSHLSPTGPNGNSGFRNRQNQNRAITHRFTGYYSGTEYKVTSGIPNPVSPDTLYLDSKSDYPPLYTQENLFTIRFGGSSRLHDMHNDGFLDSYYAQALDNKGPYGLRNDNKSQTRNVGFSGFINPQLKKYNTGINTLKTLFGETPTKNTLPGFEVPPDREEPFIIRKIGEKWGIDRVPKPKVEGLMPSLVQIDRPAHKGGALLGSLFNIADDITGRVVGREASVFADRYFADVRRINGATNALDFLVRGSRFVQAQDTLQKRNPFETTSGNMYKLAGLQNELTITTDDYIPSEYRGLVDSEELLSSQLNTRAFNPLSVFSIPGVMHINRNSYLDIGPIVAAGTIADFITKDVWNKITAKATEIITDAATSLATNWAKKKGEKLLEDNAPKIDKLKEWGETKRESAKIMVANAKKSGEKLRKQAEYFDLIPAQENQNVSKAALAKLGQTAFDDRGRDRVNLIPYGKDTYDIGGVETPLGELDWIPFKFKDVRTGRFITFRAILSGITDTFTPEYLPERYVGRPDSVHVYQGTERDIGFVFDVYPKSDSELVTLWEKLNYLSGLTYPHWSDSDASGGRGMIAPFSELTIGQMYNNTPGVITELSYTVMDEGTWETTFAKLPKYIQVNCTFKYIGKRLPSAEQKHFELPWVADKQYEPNILNNFLGVLENTDIIGGIGNMMDPDKLNQGITENVTTDMDNFADDILAENDPGPSEILVDGEWVEA